MTGITCTVISCPEPSLKGVVGVTVEIDESKWGYKRKYNRGRLVKESIWIFGIIERSTGKVDLITCSARSARELIPKINRVVLPGTSIMSDEWAAYRSLSQQEYHHTTINHTENFVDPVTGCHTQTIESFWANSKVHFKKNAWCQRFSTTSSFR